jgi:hypothetical protein
MDNKGSVTFKIRIFWFYLELYAGPLKKDGEDL